MALEDRVDENPLSSWGTPTQIDGRQAFTIPGDHVCQAFVLHRPWIDPTHLAELTEVDLSLPTGTGAAGCAPALDLPSAAAARMP